MDLYDLIERRCPARKISQYISTPISLDLEEIASIIDQTPHPYANRLIRSLIQLWEDGDLQECRQQDDLLADWLYNKLVELLPYNNDGEHPQQDIIAYTIVPGIRPKIPETRRLIGHGTTGHRTWEASLYLCQYLFKQDWLPNVDTILEIGAGTGLVSVALALAGHHVISTDGDPDVVNMLRNTFCLNEVNSRATARVLKWGEGKPPFSDLVLAADVTYDTAVIPSLCNCLQDCQNTSCIALVACTMRNLETLSFFEKYCHSIGLNVTLLSDTESNKEESSLIENLTFEPLLCPIRIYRIGLR